MVAMLGDAMDSCRDRRLIILRDDGNDFCTGRDMQPPPRGSRVSTADVVREDTGPIGGVSEEMARASFPPLYLHAQLKVLPNSGHSPMLETPAWLAPRIEAFLTRAAA